MIESPETPMIDTVKKYMGWTVLLGFILMHDLPYLPRFRLPHFDYFNVLHVINYLNHPEWFGPDRISIVLTERWTETAPLYFYGLAYPLSQLFHGKWILMTIGLLITTLIIYFAGGGWTEWRRLLTVLVVLVVLLHTSMTPLEGNRRSFLPLFILAVLWLEDHPNYLGRLFLVAVASGIYPPGALIVVVYSGLRELNHLLTDRANLTGIIGRMTGLGSVMIVVLMPYWTDILRSSSQSSIKFVNQTITYRVGSVYEFLNTFVVGDLSTKGALFRDRIQFDIFLGLIFLIGCQVVLLQEEFRFRRRYSLLLVASSLLWGVAHMVHPYIYHPFKYTRLSYLLALALPFAENLPRMVKVLQRQLRRRKSLLMLLLMLSIWSLGVWVLSLVTPTSFDFLTLEGLLGQHWWKFLLAIPVLLTVLAIPWWQPTDSLRAFCAVLILSILIFVPHTFASFNWLDMNIKNFEGLYRYLQTTPPGTTVAGPPAFYMDPIPALAHRSIYSSTNKSMLKFVCKRSKRFWKAYFSGSRSEILTFLRTNDIDYLLIDRRLLQIKKPVGNPQCFAENTRPASRPVLDRSFPNAPWHYQKRFYLIEPKQLSDLPAGR